MRVTIRNLENQEVGQIELSDELFAQPLRADLLSRTVNWQLAKRRSGNHKAKIISEISGTTKKPYRQKGTGRARQGSLRSPQFRGGAVIFGPVVRSHEHDLPKKVRKLALKVALAAKVVSGKLVVLDSLALDSHKTKELAVRLGGFGFSSALFIDGANINENFVKASRNIPRVDVLPEHGANVYDILRRDTLFLTRNAVEQLEARLK
ncbi:MAG: 50S ribosomal protein L4 [Rhodospirillaceae bacterium]